MTTSISTEDLKRRMHGAVEALRHELGGLRTGRASTALVDPVHVEVYGANMPLNQVATVSVPEPRMLSVQVWDRSNVQPVEKAIRNAGLGINPIVDGQVIRLPIPELTEERRKELAKLSANMRRRRGSRFATSAATAWTTSRPTRRSTQSARMSASGSSMTCRS